MTARTGAGALEAPARPPTAHGPALGASPRGAVARRLSDSLSARGLLVGSVFVLLAWVVIRPVQDPDYWWHVTAGHWILQHRALPGHDLFTYTAAAHPWVDHEYLSEIALHLLQQSLGVAGVSVLFGAISLAGIWLIDRRSQLEPQPYVIRALLLGLAGVAGSPFWGPRPQMLTFFFVCLELYWLERFLLRGDRQIYWFPLLMVLWANLHGGFLIGFLFLCIALVARLAEAVARRQRRPAVEALRIGLVGLASVAGALLTPYTYRLFSYAAEPQASPLQQSLILEWLSPDFHALAFKPFEAMVLALVAGMAFSRPRLYEVLLALATLTLALQSVRHVPIFLAACTPILIRLYGDAWRRLARERGWRLPRSQASPALAAVTASVLLALAVFIGIAAERRLAAQEALTRTTYPVAASDWLAAHPGVGTRMFNSYGWGGYLVYRFYPTPQRRVFVFGEATLMGDEQLQSYADIAGIRADWQTRLRSAGVDYVVFNRNAPLSNALAVDPHWRLAYEDRVAVVYVRVPEGPTAAPDPR
ncbi:MAG: hypothetical protein DLM67_08495 [Candidatus Nephthysia bennettiae]|uniref:DUF2723 domain-containing protein n=1 Tax=Candidatus Nephthysia bennettiae TaxID=3127016 RepID=A0A934K5U7_9BACT|nr:hypothetical protein [Candidatus Dormibacteraeota bacterium]MBJ7611958.1 hypothetical protein [Candidatus Dormibacteraeota bacterium]PZR97212.1 MAG: hypothetical protein DLM67_08495 [Candidatus Dormibacteraeota bacterium]